MRLDVGSNCRRRRSRSCLALDRLFDPRRDLAIYARSVNLPGGVIRSPSTRVSFQTRVRTVACSLGRMAGHEHLLRRAGTRCSRVSRCNSATIHQTRADRNRSRRACPEKCLRLDLIRGRDRLFGADPARSRRALTHSGDEVFPLHLLIGRELLHRSGEADAPFFDDRRFIRDELRKVQVLL